MYRGVHHRVFSSEIEAIESKMRGYSSRIATLETDLSEAQQELNSLQKEDDRLVETLSVLLQKLTVAEKRVYGVLLEELGVESLQQLETEMVGKMRENEAMQAECRTHIALLQNKKKYGLERLENVEREYREQVASKAKAERKLNDLRSRLEGVTQGIRELDDELEGVQISIVNIQHKIHEEESKITVVDQRIREVALGERMDCRNETRRRSWMTLRQVFGQQSRFSSRNEMPFFALPLWSRSRFRY